MPISKDSDNSDLPGQDGSRFKRSRFLPSDQGDVAQTALVGVILLLALVARLVYGYDLPLMFDEVSHLAIAEEFSLFPDSFHLPFGNRLTNHPNGVLYLTAATNWIGGGSVFVIRVVFIIISLVGLLGVYFLARSFFGHEAATLALLLAATDRYMISMAGRFYEPSVSLALVPWALLAMRMSLDRDRLRDWVLLGILWGIGGNTYYIFLFQPMIFVVYLLLSGKALSVLRQPRAYVALSVCVLLMVPHIMWNLANEWSSVQYGIEKPGGLGMCPRVAMFYLGDILLCFTDVTWLSLNAGDKIHQPIQLTSSC